MGVRGGRALSSQRISTRGARPQDRTPANRPWPRAIRRRRRGPTPRIVQRALFVRDFAHYLSAVDGRSQRGAVSCCSIAPPATIGMTEPPPTRSGRAGCSPNTSIAPSGGSRQRPVRRSIGAHGDGGEQFPENNEPISCTYNQPIRMARRMTNSTSLPIAVYTGLTAVSV